MKLREEISHYGAASLTLEQLFALIIGSGTKNHQVTQIVKQLASISNDFTNLEELNTENLLHIKGIGLANQSRILALIELCRRLNHHQQLSYMEPTTIDMIGKHLLIKYCNYYQEELTGIFLDINQNVLLEKNLFRGSLTSATVHPREVIRIALTLPCTSIVVAHNHPSGNLQASKADLEFTRRLISCCQFFDIKLLDHLIVGQDDFSRIRAQGLL